MKDFAFLHMADLHLGSPFKGLAVDDPATAARFAQAIRTTFSALVTRAIEQPVDFVVVAGDVYDGEWRDASIGLFFNREMARLDRAGVPVFLVKGNHDAESVVTRSVPLPDSVLTFGASAATTRTIPHLGVALHGQSYRDREAPDNIARDYPAAKPDHFNIGILHTSLSGDADHGTYAPCTEADLVAKGYDYWALGHIHRPIIVRERPPIVFPGCIQGRSVRELGAHGAVLVRVADGAPTLERWEEDQVRWCAIALDLTGVEDFAAEAPPLVQEAVRAAIADTDGRAVALRVVLEGATVAHPWLLANRDEARTIVQAAMDHAAADVWLEKLKVETRAPADDGIDDEGFAVLLDGTGDDPHLRAALDVERAQLMAKMPAEAETDLDIEALLEEARALLSARLGA